MGHDLNQWDQMWGVERVSDQNASWIVLAFCDELGRGKTGG